MNANRIILVADDNDVARRLCQRILQKTGYSVLIAVDGLEAVDLAVRERPAMVLMDVTMPGIDGLEAMRRIKSQLPAMSVVVMSAHGMASDRAQFLAAGANDVLTKPFRLADLVAIVNKLATVEDR